MYTKGLSEGNYHCDETKTIYEKKLNFEPAYSFR